MSNNDHIPTEEIRQDILDTEREIFIMGKEAAAFRLLAETGDRMADMRARARESGIEERKAFITKLQAILASREPQKDQA